MPATVSVGSAERHRSVQALRDEGASTSRQCHLRSGLKWSVVLELACIDRFSKDRFNIASQFKG